MVSSGRASLKEHFGLYHSWQTVLQASEQMWAQIEHFPSLNLTLTVGLGGVCQVAYLFIVANSECNMVKYGVTSLRGTQSVAPLRFLWGTSWRGWPSLVGLHWAVGGEDWALVPADQQHEEEMVRVQALCLYASGVCFLHLGRGSSTP